MDPEPVDWRDAAFDPYPLAWSELLQKWKRSSKANVEYDVEELKEALLDLKQATIDDDPSRALNAIEEATLLLAELRLRSQDG